jgi:hypothetical protein
MLERSVAKIRAANPSISHRDAVRQAVRERQSAGTGTGQAGGPPAKAPATAQQPSVSAAPSLAGGGSVPAALTASHGQMLEIFIRMFKRPGPPLEAYKVYPTVAEYEAAWRRLPSYDPRARIPPGYTSFPDRIIHLPPNANTLTVFHEALHWASNNAGFRQRMGAFVDEGMTEWLSQRAFGPQAYRINYGQNVAFVKLLTRYVDESTLTSAFLDSNWQPLYSALEQRLGSSTAAEGFVELLRRTPVGGGETLGRAMDMLMR